MLESCYMNFKVYLPFEILSLAFKAIFIKNEFCKMTYFRKKKYVNVKYSSQILSVNTRKETIKSGYMK